MNLKNYNDAYDQLEKFESRSMHGQLPVYWKSAKNSIVKDHDGKKYIDFTSTIFVANIGHSNLFLKRRLKKAINSNLIHSYTYLNKYRVDYIKKLVQFVGDPFEKAYLASSGTEATETAMRLMRLNGYKTNKNKLGIISFKGNYHGRTLGAYMMSGFSSGKEWIGYSDPNIYHLDFPYPWEVSEKDGAKFFKSQIKKLKKKINSFEDKIAGFMIESFQGWGALFYPKSFIKELVDFCNENNILVCFDEMQAGFYRTGMRFGFENYDIKPDLICIGKGMGSGLPISGVVGKKSVMDLPNLGEMSSTNSANPLVCTAGLATIDFMSKKSFQKNLSSRVLIFEKELKNIEKTFEDVKTFGKGMIGALLFFDKKGNPNINKANKVVEKCLQNGLIVVRTGRESIKIGPPLTTRTSLIKKGFSILKDSIENFS